MARWGKPGSRQAACAIELSHPRAELSPLALRWQVLINNLKESAALPHLADEIARLEALLARARALQNRYEHFRTQAQEVRAELAEVGREGDSVRGRLGAGLRAKFGFTSETLARYGFKAQGLRRLKATTPPAKPESAAAPAAPLIANAATREA